MWLWLMLHEIVVCLVQQQPSKIKYELVHVRCVQTWLLEGVDTAKEEDFRYVCI